MTTPKLIRREPWSLSAVDAHIAIDDTLYMGVPSSVRNRRPVMDAGPSIVQREY